MIILDAGHGGSKARGGSSPIGTRGALGTQEKDVTLELERRIAARLGGDARLTRCGDTAVSLAERAALSRAARVFVSLHANAGGPGEQGAETWIHSRAAPSSRGLALSLQGALQRLAPTDRGVRAADLALLRPEMLGPGCAACLVEVDFLSHAVGEKRLRSPVELERIASALAHAIREHLGRESTSDAVRAGRGARALEASDTPPNQGTGVIGVRDYLAAVQAVERAYPGKSTEEILTLIRGLYYGTWAGSGAFDHLIPGAPTTQALKMCTDDEGTVCRDEVGVCVCRYADGLSVNGEEREAFEAAVSLLKQRASENAEGDNPSPYIWAFEECVDVGHVLVGADAFLHPSTGWPFSSNGLTQGQHVATWAGDLGAAMVWLSEHEGNGAKPDDVVGNPSATIEDYYRNSLPRTDLLGDVDAFALGNRCTNPNLSLSDALAYCYVNESGGPPYLRDWRWRQFCASVGLQFDVKGGSVRWGPGARDFVIQQIKLFADMFSQRNSPGGWLITGVSRQPWPKAGEFADRFLRDLEPGLVHDMELARKP